MLADFKGPIWIVFGGPNSLSHGSEAKLFVCVKNWSCLDTWV